MSDGALLGDLAGPREAVQVGPDTLTRDELAGAAAVVAERLAAVTRAALWATPSLETVVGVVGAIGAGTTVVPVNPGSGERELEHVVADAAPEALLVPTGVELPATLRSLSRIDVATTGRGKWSEGPSDPEATAIILYTSGTTGLPKGVQIPRRAIAANLDALAEAWSWTAADRLAHALPLFHVHGLVLGVLGPLRIGGELEHLGRFSPGAVGDALDRGATMVFGVPTMYHRLAEEAESDTGLAQSLGRARLLVSGSAALPAIDHRRLQAVCGQQVVERYGMTETLMISGVRADGERIPGYVGDAFPGVEVRLVDDDGAAVDMSDDETVGEVTVRGDGLFTGYLNRADATAAAFRDGWFLTGDLATRAPSGYLRLVGRRSTDIIKSGGYKIGALEIEGALLEHPAVSEAAVLGVPDPDLGERVAAWVVLRAGMEADEEELEAHVKRLLSSHKRPRELHFVDDLPRNPMGKVVKARLRDGSG